MNDDKERVNCGKHFYPSEKDARTALNAYRSSRNFKKKRPSRAYKCEECGGWHLTSKKNVY